MSFFKKLFGRKEETKEVVKEEEYIDDKEKVEEVSEPETTEKVPEEPEKTEAIKEAEKLEVAPVEKEKLEESQETEKLEERSDESEKIVEVRVSEKVEEVETATEKSLEISEHQEVEEVSDEVEEEEIEKEEISAYEAMEEQHLEEEASNLEAIEVVATEVDEPKKKKGFFSKLVEGLSKTRDQFMGTVDEVLKGFKKIDEDLYEELEEVLIMADFGVDTTLSIMGKLREIVKERKITEPELLKDTLKEVITTILTSQEITPIIDETKQNVVLVIGVNGVGKTTSIGKLANQFKNDNKKVVLAAADTFRAAAIDQLAVWANRAGVDLIKHDEGTDPAAVVFDGIQAAKARKADILICDTAGRLQNKTNLMKELEKIGRIIDREYPDAHKEVLIVLDATTGQNAISQVKVFKEVAKVDGIILTKLDGTAKGGAVVGICESLQVPVKYIGVGEKIEDLQVFDPQAFADALFAKSQK